MITKSLNDDVQLTEEQMQQISQFIKLHPEVSREVALKFNLGRKFVPEKVEACYRNYQKTVLEHHFDTITVADVLDELRTQKLYVPGTRDRNGAALFVINANKHVPGQFPQEQTLKLAFYMGELLTASPKTAQVGVTIISNMEGMEWANFDNQFQRTIINFFQSNIPARVKNILLYKSPWWVSMLVKMVSPFLKQKMRERVHILEEGQLEQFIDKDQIPMDLGGTFQYDHDTFLKREMAKVPSSKLLGTAPAPTVDQGVEESHKRPPPGTIMLISDELADALNEERSRVLRELDEKIRRRRESLKEHSLPLDISKMLRSKSARMSLDMSAIPSLEPNLLHLADSRVTQPSVLVASKVSPITERPGEDYSYEKLKRRIRDSIMEDRKRFIKSTKRYGTIIGDDKDREESLSPILPESNNPKRSPSESPIMAARPTRRRFSTFGLQQHITDEGAKVDDKENAMVAQRSEASPPHAESVHSPSPTDPTAAKRRSRRIMDEARQRRRGESVLPLSTDQ